MRFILLIIALGIGFWIIKHLLRSRHNNQSTKEESTTKMVRCEHCDLHVPAQQAIQKDEKYFCCEIHSKQYQQKD